MQIASDFVLRNVDLTPTATLQKGWDMVTIAGFGLLFIAVSLLGTLAIYCAILDLRK